MTNDTLEGKAVANELAAIESILVPCMKGADHMPHVPDYTERDLDRLEADDDMRFDVDSLEMDKAGTDGLAAVLARDLEEQRIRRDVKIMRMGHKRLMLGCLETLYRRKLKLAKMIANGD